MTELRKGLTEKSHMLSDIEAGDTFELAGYEFVVLERLENGIAVILRDLWRDEEVFSESNNNFDGSNADKLCREFEKELSEKCGAEIFIEHRVVDEDDICAVAIEMTLQDE